MSEKIAIFKDLDDLANLTAGTSAGYITDATDEMCVSKGNFDTVSSKTIAANGNGLMFVEGSESSKYTDSNRLVLLKDVQYVSEITATLVSAPNIPANGGSSYATWKLTQYYKAIGEADATKVEWQVTGSVVEKGSKGTTISNITDAGNSTKTETKNGKSISLSQMIKQNGNYVTELTISGHSLSYAAIGAGATSASPTHSGGTVTYKFISGSTTTTAPSSTYGSLSATHTYSLASSQNGFTAVNSSTGTLTATSRGTTIGNARSSATVTCAGSYKWTPTSSYNAAGTITKSSSATATCTQNGNYVTELTISGHSLSYAAIGAGATSASPTHAAGTLTYKFSSGGTTTTKPGTDYGSLSDSHTYTIANTTTNGFTAVNSSSGVLTATGRGTTIGNARTSATVTCTRTCTWTPTSSYNAAGTKTKTNAVTATCTQNGNYVTELTISGHSLSYAAIGAGATSASPTHAAGTLTYKFSSGGTTTTKPGTDYGSLSDSHTYTLSESKNGFTKVGASDGKLTATGRGTTTGPARTSGTVTCTRTCTWTPTASYNSAGTKTKTSAVTATCTQNLNKMVSISGTTSTFSYDSKVAAGGGNVTPTLSGAAGTVTFSSGSTLAAGSCNGYTYTRTWAATNSGLWTLDTSNGKLTASSKGSSISNETTSITVTGTGICSVVNPSDVGGDTVSQTVTATATAKQAANYVTKVEPQPSTGTAHVVYSNISAGGTTSSPSTTGSAKYTFSSGSTSNDSTTSPSFGGSSTYTRTYAESKDETNSFTVNTSNGTVTTSARGTTPGEARSVTVAATLVVNYTHASSYSSGGSVSGTRVDNVVVTQNENKITSYGNWTVPTVTVNPTSFAAAGGTATITISGDSTRENTWSSGSKSTDTAYKSNKSASFATISSDYKTLTVSVNTTGSNRTGKVYVDWSFNNTVVKSVESNSYSQIAQTECTMSLTSDTKVYHNTAVIKGKASVKGKIYWGTSSNSMSNVVSITAVDTDTQITSRDSLGTTTIYAYFVPDSSEYTTLGSSSKYHASASAKITQASDASVAVSTSNKTYNGSAQTVVTCSSDQVHGTSEWYIGYTTSETSTSPTWGSKNANLSLTNAGTYYIWKKWTADSNHSNGSSGEKIDATVVISKKSATVTAGTTSKTYDGSALSYNSATLSGQVSGHTLDSYTCSGSIINVGSTNNTPSNAKIYSGSTDVTSNYNISYVKGTLTITNASFTVSAPNQTFTYSGGAQGNAITVTGLKGSQSATIKYGTTSGTYNLTSAPKITNANEDTTVYWQVTATYHTTQTGSYTLTMNQDNGAGSVTMNGWVYGATVANPSPSSSNNGISNVTYTWYDGDKNKLSAKPSSTSAVGTYYVKATFAATTNYKEYTTDYVSFSISNATITVSAGNQSYVYNGNAQGAAITASTKGSQTATIKYGTTSGSYTTTTAPTLTTVGSTTVYYQVTASNHTTKTGSYTLAITNASFTVSEPDQSYTYTGSAQGAAITVSGLKGSQSATIKYGTTSGSYTTTSVQKLTNVGSTTVYWQVTAPNHTTQTGSYTLTISQRTVTITAPTATGRTYNGSDQTIFAAGSATTGGTMYYSETNKTFSTSTWSTSLPYTQKTNAGTYTLYYYCHVSDTTNNKGTDINTIKSISATINKATTTINYSPGDVSVQAVNSNSTLGTARAVTLERPTLANGVIVDYTFTINSVIMSTGANMTSYFQTNNTVISISPNAGVTSYTISMTVNINNVNYTADPVTKTFKIRILPDERVYEGILSINSTSNLSAAADSRTITWGNIRNVWKYGRNPIGLVSGTATLSISCSVTNGNNFVTLSKTSYTNSASATTSTLTKSTYGTTRFANGATYTINLTCNGTVVNSLTLVANANEVVHTLTGVTLSYTTASYTSGSTNTPTVKYSTSYEWSSGVTGTTSSNTSNVTNATFTKTFEVYQTNTASNYATLNTSTGIVTWNSANTGSTSRAFPVRCTGTLTSGGKTSAATSTPIGVIQSPQPSTSPIESYIGGVTCDTNGFSSVVGSDWATYIVFTKAIPSDWVGHYIYFKAYDANKTLIPHPGGGSNYEYSFRLTEDIATGTTFPKSKTIQTGMYSGLGGTSTKPAKFIKISKVDNPIITSGSYIGVTNI